MAKKKIEKLDYYFLPEHVTRQMEYNDEIKTIKIALKKASDGFDFWKDGYYTQREATGAIALREYYRGVMAERLKLVYMPEGEAAKYGEEFVFAPCVTGK